MTLQHILKHGEEAKLFKISSSIVILNTKVNSIQQSIKLMMLLKKLWSTSTQHSQIIMSISEETKFPCHVGITDLKSKQECNKWTLLITKLYKFIIVNNKKKSGDKSPRIKKPFIGRMKKLTCLFKVTMSFNGGVSVKILIDWKVINS